MAMSGLNNSTLREFLKFVIFDRQNWTRNGKEIDFENWREEIAIKSERSIVLLVVLLCLVASCIVVFLFWRKIYGDLPFIHLLNQGKVTPSPNTPDPPPTYTKTLSHPSPLSLGDHLAPPPSYSRARELSESDDTFLPLEMMNMEKIQEMDIEDLEEEEEDTSDNNIEILHCTNSSNLRCSNCLHRLHI